MSGGFLSPSLLIPLGKNLLMGSFGFCLVRSMRGSFDLHLSFERLVVAFLSLTFFQAGAEVLLKVSSDLAQAIEAAGRSHDLKAILLDAFRRSSQEAAGGLTPDLPGVFAQAWRTGVWGVMSTVVDGVFLIVTFLLESARDVFWSLLLFLFPVACGMYPVFPRMLTNLAIYAVELALWFPVLAVIQLTTGAVARKAMTRSGSLGMDVVAVELLAIILILLIPSVTHRFLSGAFSGDFESQASMIRTAKKAIVIAKSWGMRS